MMIGGSPPDFVFSFGDEANGGRGDAPPAMSGPNLISSRAPRLRLFQSGEATGPRPHLAGKKNRARPQVGRARFSARGSRASRLELEAHAELNLALAEERAVGARDAVEAAGAAVEVQGRAGDRV